MRTFPYLFLAVACLATNHGPAEAVPKGSYLQSCQDVQETGGHNREISAQCRDSKGRYRYSSLRYRDCQGDIANVNGQLWCTGGRQGSDRPDNGWGGGWGENDRPGYGSGGRLPGGSWTQSCRNYDMRGNILTAECKRRKEWVQTQINLRKCQSRNVANMYGNLICQD